MGIRGGLLDWSSPDVINLLKGNRVPGERKDTNLDLVLLPETIVFFSRHHSSYGKSYNGGADFLGLWDYRKAQIILKALILPQDGVCLYEFAHKGLVLSGMFKLCWVNKCDKYLE